MFLHLLRTRRFAPLFWCQFFSAFNDNFVRNMLAMLILFRLGEHRAGALVTLAIGIFILPSIFLSALGGELADSQDKARVARALKLGELFVQGIAALGFVFASLPLLYLALFGLGVIAALFGPIKYGILPDHLETRELTAGNALIEGATFLAILLGLIVGGFAAVQGRSPLSVVAQLTVVALACWIASWFIPGTRAAAPDLRPDRNLLASTWRAVHDLRMDARSWTGGLAVSWFWLTGAVSLSLVPVVLKSRLGAGIEVATAINALFAIGMALGSSAAALWARGRIFLTPVSGAAFGMGAFLLDLAFTTGRLPAVTAELSLSQFLGSFTGLRLSLDVIGLAACGGLFVVPTFAAVQAWAGEDRRARVVAGVNIVNSLFIVAGSLLTSLLQAAGFSEPVLLGALGALNLLVALWLLHALSRKSIGSAAS
ncbi:MAG TPA: MFS transporter [Beijerinckiaceae bacterium]|nr:MFS transporter [Beijerinckiaceae bacterium]